MTAMPTVRSGWTRLASVLPAVTLVAALEAPPSAALTEPAILARAATAAAPATATELPCGALTAADIAGLGFGQSREGSPGAWQNNVSLGSSAAIFGREADCLWATPSGTVTLTVGDFDANVVKGDQVRTLARKVLASIQAEMKSQEQYTGSRWTIAPLAGVGEEAFVASLHRTHFQVVAFQGPRLVRLLVDGGELPPARRHPTARRRS